MARKNLLKGLMEEATSPTPSDEETRVDLAKPRYSSGAIGAVSQSISELKSRAVQEIDPRMVDDAGIKDRLDDTAGLDDLIASITEYGQQVPVLLRPNPIYPERYQVVYGRRRVAALKAMNQPVRALIRVLNDRDLIMAQGQENSARRDLSFIERVNFARQMQDMKYDRKVICDALHVDKTLISRMLAVADRVPEPLITAIGAAPSVGRDRWLKLAELLEGASLDDAISAAQGDTSDTRFDAVFAALSPARTPPAPKSQKALRGSDGKAIGVAKQSKGKTVLTLDAKTSAGFETWLVENISELHARWKQDDGS